jgi:alkylhydroperoxidase family enzyme
MDKLQRRTVMRIGLLVLALPQLAIAVWALATPRGWFYEFPGGGKMWLPLYGPYDEHLVRDVASAFLGLGVLLVLAAVWMNRRVVQAAIVAYLAYQLPHAIYHVGADDRLSAGDQVLNTVGLWVTVVLAGGLLALGRPRSRRLAGGAAGAAVAETGRLGSPPPRGLLAGAARWYGRRRFGRPLSTVDAYLHHPRLLMGYGSFETAVERSHRVDERLKLLAELKAAAVVGCEWCMDFGSWLSHGQGVPERQLRELPRYRESGAFSELEKLVLDYATAMTRTPAEVTDDLFARLRDYFNDAQLVELTNVIAVENHRARFNHALGLDPQGFSEGSFCVTPERASAPAASRASATNLAKTRE